MSVNEVKLKKAAEKFVVRGSGKPTSRTFCLGDEDHTIGNALRHVLIRNSAVSFAGYSVPHPSEPVVHIRVQTVAEPSPVTPFPTLRYHEDDDGEEQHQQNPQPHQQGEAITAIDALKQACQTLYSQCDIVMEQLEEILPEVREDRITMENLLLSYDDEEEEFIDEDDSDGIHEDQ